jgi:ABC-2 type transport system ATP-binding protein
MMFFSRLYGMDRKRARSRIGELLETFDLLELGHCPFHTFSNGNKQRLALVRALLPDPPLMLLDEPTRSLDPIAADGLRRLILERIGAADGKTVLITSHNLAEVEQLCSRVAILSRNAVKECAPLEELRAKYSGREEVKIRLRGAASDDGLGRLRERVPDLMAERPADGALEIAFSRRIGDVTLHSVLKEAISMGLEIVSCDRKSLGLKEIMEVIEQGDAKP